MVAWRYKISLLVLKKIFSTLEEKFRISARPCNIVYKFKVIIGTNFLGSNKTANGKFVKFLKATESKKKNLNFLPFYIAKNNLMDHIVTYGGVTSLSNSGPLLLKGNLEIHTPSFLLDFSQDPSVIITVILWPVKRCIMC